MNVLVAFGTSTAYSRSIYEAFKTIGTADYMPHLYLGTSALLITLILFGKRFRKCNLDGLK